MRGVRSEYYELLIVLMLNSFCAARGILMCAEGYEITWRGDSPARE